MPRESSNDEITLGLLAVVEADGKISQRALSNELGVALVLTNTYLKRCVCKGFIKIQQVPRRRSGYYMTPQGFAEKTRRTAEYLTSSLTLRRARTQLDEIMATCAARGSVRIALAGATEIAEIATLTAHDHDVVLACVIDSRIARPRFCGLAVVASLEEIGEIDAVIFKETRDSGVLGHALRQRLGEERVITPRLVKLAHINETAKRSRAAQGSAAARSDVAGTGKPRE